MNTTDKLAEALRRISTYPHASDSHVVALRNIATEALAAHDAEQAAEAVPAGFKLVPVEPTPKMIERGRWDEFGEDCTRAYPVPDYYVTDVWAAMLEAAPTPPAPEAQRREPLTDEQIAEGRYRTWAAEPDDAPEAWAFMRGARWAEKHFGIGATTGEQQ